MFREILAGAAFAALAAPAVGGGLAPVVETVEVVPPVAAPAPSADWSGFYAGLRAGTADLEISYPSAGTTFSSGYDADGGFYGGMIGYRHDFGRFVVGGELRYSDMSDVTVSKGPPGTTYDSLTTAMLQVGYDMGRVLPFIGVGATRLSANLGGTSQSDNGIIYGIGVDFMVTPRIMLGLDANRFEIDDFGTTGEDITGTTVALRAAFKF